MIWILEENALINLFPFCKDLVSMESGDFDLAKFHFHASHFDFNFTSNIVAVKERVERKMR